MFVIKNLHVRHVVKPISSYRRLYTYTLNTIYAQLMDFNRTQMLGIFSYTYSLELSISETVNNGVWN
jgi:hypothetical protein